MSQQTFDARVTGTGMVGVGPLLRASPNSDIVARLEQGRPVLRERWHQPSFRDWWLTDPAADRLRRTYHGQFQAAHGRLPGPEDWTTLFDGFVAKETETSDDWIFKHTGIRSRNVVMPNVATSDLAAEAARQALIDAQVEPKDVDGLFLATVSPDHPHTPPTTALVSRRLGLRTGGIEFLDVSEACSSFVVALRQAALAIYTGRCRCIVVVGAEAMSTTVSPLSRSLYPILGDGAAAFVLQACKAETFPNFTPQNFDSFLYPELAELIVTPSGGSRKAVTVSTVENPFDQSHLIFMDGPAVRKRAVRMLVPTKAGEPAVIPDALARAGYPTGGPTSLRTALNSLDLMVFHQANGKICEDVEERLREFGYRGEFYDNIESYGNTTSATIPLLIHEARASGRLQEGMQVMAVVFGGGFTAATAIWVQ